MSLKKIILLTLTTLFVSNQALCSYWNDPSHEEEILETLAAVTQQAFQVMTLQALQERPIGHTPWQDPKFQPCILDLTRKINSEAAENQYNVIERLHKQFGAHMFQEVFYGNFYKAPRPSDPTILMFITRFALRDRDLTNIDFLGQFTHLVALDLCTCKISGDDETFKTLGALTNLTHLDLHDIQPGRNFSVIGGLTKLTYLDLSASHYNNMPLNIDYSFLMHLTNLETLHMAMRRYENDKQEAQQVGLAKQGHVLAPLAHLRVLDIDHNHMGEGITVLRNLTCLENLRMKCNNVGQHLTALAGLPFINDLSLEDDYLGGSLTVLQTLPLLKILQLKCKGLADDASALLNLSTTLESIHLCGNLGEQTNILEILRDKGIEVLYFPIRE